MTSERGTRDLKTGLGARLVSNVDTAARPPMSSLPVINLERLSSSHLEERKALAAEIQDACLSSGFFYVSNHSIPQNVLDNAFEQGKRFFNQDLEKKMLIDIHKGTSFKGYLPIKGEKVDPDSNGDVHESFQMGLDSQKFSADKVSSGNQWPSKEDLPQFREGVEAAWNEIMNLGKRLFPLLALALDLDYECFTILVQGDVPALEVLNTDGEWIHAPPIPGTLVVNIGDQLQRWTNDVFKSTIHRAINRSGAERYSMPFFFGTNYETVLEVLPSCITPGKPAKYEPIAAGAWLEQRLSETYGKKEELAA